ncbi:winged helix DNA-binding protein [uncultured Methanobrevibacter sp.]|uniref:winged helix DNA-binding protein n=1 Tax=uncultured Methanobrevibacter sp. TaxID=253161 RepID=UPI0025CF9182|nr:winged helix DNA-binding protein [uncultured Methanobrevibacter sp.]
MELSDEMWKEVGFVISSGYRSKVMKSLDGQTKIPTQIAKDTEILQNHMSAVLKQLGEHELVECVNPEARKGRLYRLTDKGEEIVKEL